MRRYKRFTAIRAQAMKLGRGVRVLTVENGRSAVPFDSEDDYSAASGGDDLRRVR
jgi:hypothetical protein